MNHSIPIYIRGMRIILLLQRVGNPVRDNKGSVVAINSFRRTYAAFLFPSVATRDRDNRGNHLYTLSITTVQLVGISSKGGSVSKKRYHVSHYPLEAERSKPGVY